MSFSLSESLPVRKCGYSPITPLKPLNLGCGEEYTVNNKLTKTASHHQHDELADGHRHFDWMEVVECLVCVHELTQHTFPGF